MKSIDQLDDTLKKLVLTKPNSDEYFEVVMKLLDQLEIDKSKLRTRLDKQLSGATIMHCDDCCSKIFENLNRECETKWRNTEHCSKDECSFCD